VCVLVAEIDTSVFRNADIPKVGGSDYRSAEMPIRHFGSPKCRYSAFRVSDLGNKGMSLSCLHIKASEFQCRLSLLLELAGCRPIALLYTIKLP